MFPFANYKDFVHDQFTLDIINDALKEVLYECYTNTNYNDGAFNHDLLSKMYGKIALDVHLFYPILINNPFDEKFKALKNIIIKIAKDNVQVRDFLTNLLVENFNNVSLTIRYEILSSVGTKIVNHDELCPLILIFNNDQRLTINKLLFQHFDCFGCFDDDLLTNQIHHCDYNYDCVKIMIDYFFTGVIHTKYLEQCLFKNDIALSLLFEINKLGFISPLTDQISQQLNADPTLIPNLYETNTFLDFLSECEIIISMSDKYKNNNTLNVMIFLKQYLDYDVVQLLYSSCYQTYIKSCLTYSDFFMNKITQIFDHDMDQGLKILPLLPVVYMEDSLIMDRLNTLTHIDNNLLSKLSLKIQLTLGLKFLKFDYLDTLLPMDISLGLLLYLIRFYKNNSANDLKWQYIKRSICDNMHCSPTQMNYRIKNCFRFVHIHSFNPSPRHIVVFNYIGTVHSLLYDGNDYIGIIINLSPNQAYELDVHKRLYIGEYYNKDITYGIKELCYNKFPNQPEYIVNTLLNTSNKEKYGSIIFDQLYELNIKVGDAIFVEKLF